MSTEEMTDDVKAGGAPAADIAPNHTIYVKNLNEKVKLDELKKSLYHVFGQFGNILEVNASKTLKNRGQAWVVFDDLSGATKALRDMQSFMFYGKPMKVAFAKSKSDCVAKIDGSFVPRPKRKLDAPDGKKKKRGGADKKDKEGEVKEPKEKKRKREDTKKSVKSENHTGGEESAPNKILFVENLPPQCTQEMLKALFEKYAGFKEARMVTGKPGIAFVEFNDQFQATQARDGLQNFKIAPHITMRVSYAKQG